MIFTRRFGALAARPSFSHVEERTIEQELELLVSNDATHEQGAVEAFTPREEREAAHH